MKKIISLLVIITLMGCTDEIFEPMDIDMVDVPNSLMIDGATGLKIESTIVSEEVRMNIKLPYTGTYRIKIRDIGKQIISQEKISANEGDNLLKVYVSSLPNDGYSIELTDNDHVVLGITSFVVNNN